VAAARNARKEGLSCREGGALFVRWLEGIVLQLYKGAPKSKRVMCRWTQRGIWNSIRPPYQNMKYGTFLIQSILPRAAHPPFQNKCLNFNTILY
jgi:hypothetical protein